MSYTDPEVYSFDGECYCDECGSDLEGDEVGAEAYATPGETCGQCGAFYADGAWRPAEMVDDYRWLACTRGRGRTNLPGGCNARYPIRCDDARARLDAMRGRLACPSCDGELHAIAEDR